MDSSMGKSGARVLVTGGSGFIAGHCILDLLASGYEVRTTVRSLEKEKSVRSVLADAGLPDDRNLTFVEADLMQDDGWAQAMQDIDYVLHVASPVHPGRVQNEDDLIVPAREGTLRVLRAAREAGVKRLVLTSAFHAVSWGHRRADRVFTEADWTDLDGPGVDAYGKSKTLAERAAWRFMEDAGAPMELVAMLPVAVMGPVMGKEVSGSNHVIQSILNGDIPAFPHIFIPIVDVRDVARAHVLAMTASGAAGQRFLLSNGPAIELSEIGRTLRARLGQAARKVPTRSIPDLALRAGALFNAEARALLHDLGYAKKTSNEKARRMLDWVPGDPKEAIVAAAESLVAKGLTK